MKMLNFQRFYGVFYITGSMSIVGVKNWFNVNSWGKKYSNEEIMGKPIIKDKTGIEHLGISQFPFIITKVKSGKLKNPIDLAKQNPNLLVADYPRDMLDIRTDDELVNLISSKENNKLEYLGAIIYGDTKDVNEITGKYQLWRME